MLEIKYKLSTNKIPPMEWDDYERIATEELKRLLEDKGDKEEEFQKFFENNSAFVPGGFDLDDGSGHMPHLAALISKPPLQGHFRRIPDFLWLSFYSGVVHPILIEIEAPNKKCFNADGSSSQEFNHALDQIKEWQVWLKEPAHEQIFKKHFELDSYWYFHSCDFIPKFLLIYGRRHEFAQSEKLKKLREQFSSANCKVRSYDGLKPSYKCKDCFTVRLTEQGYEAVGIMPTFKIYPSCAKDYSRIKNKEVVIQDNPILSKERKYFLIERFKYWDNWIATTEYGARGPFNGADWE